MKKYILITISAFALSHSAFAQNNQSQHYPTKQNCNIHLHKGNPNYSHFDILPAVNDEDSSNETPMPWSVTGFFLTRPLLLSLIY